MQQAAADPTIAGLVLAGGRGSRMQADILKPLLRLGRQTLLEHVLARLTPEIAPVLVSAKDPEAFARFALPVIPDRIAGFAGPLAGLDAAAAHLAQWHPAATHLLMLPGDTPFLPPDLIAQLTAKPSAVARVARHAGALQPTVTLWPMAGLAALPGFLARPGKHSIRGFLDLIGFEPVDFGADPLGRDPFFNVNTPTDLAAAEDRNAGR